MMKAEAVIKRNNVKVIGDGEQVMLFAHGFGCDQRAWKFIVDAFTADYKVVLFDYTGSGQSRSANIALINIKIWRGTFRMCLISAKRLN